MAKRHCVVSFQRKQGMGVREAQELGHDGRKFSGQCHHQWLVVGGSQAKMECMWVVSSATQAGGCGPCSTWASWASPVGGFFPTLILIRQRLGAIFCLRFFPTLPVLCQHLGEFLGETGLLYSSRYR